MANLIGIINNRFTENIIQKIITSENHNISFFPSFKDTLQFIVVNNPDLIIFQSNIEDYEHYIEYVRKISPSTKFLLLRLNSTVLNEIESLRIPFDETQLIEKITKVLT